MHSAFRYIALICAWCSLAFAAIVAPQLSRGADTLNTTDYDAVDAFIAHWTSPDRRTPDDIPKMWSMLLPLAGRVQQRQMASCSDGYGCLNGGPCCGTGCCAPDSICCGHDTAFWSAICINDAYTCCAPRDSNPFACDGDQTCVNDDRKCRNPVTTETFTTTEWTTETETVTQTTQDTTTVVTTTTKEETTTTTISGIDTGTTTMTVTSTVSTTATAATGINTSAVARRFVTRTAFKRPVVDVAVATRTATPPEHIFNIRPAPSLDQLADALRRRGVSIERRSTVTATVWQTEEATATVTETETETDWTTIWSTDLSTQTSTTTVYKNYQTLVTATETTTTTTTTTVPPSATEYAGGRKPSSDGGGTSKKVIIGGAVGGGAGLLAIVAVSFCWHRQRKNNAEATNLNVSLTQTASMVSPSPMPADYLGRPKSVEQSEIGRATTMIPYSAVEGYGQMCGQPGWVSPSAPSPQQHDPQPSHEFLHSRHISHSELSSPECSVPCVHAAEMPESPRQLTYPTHRAELYEGHTRPQNVQEYVN